MLLFEEYNEHIEYENNLQLFEGGRAFKDLSNFTAKNSNEIKEEVIKLMEDKFGLNSNQWAIVGSFNNKSGNTKINDIDIIVKIDAISTININHPKDIDRVLTNIQNKLKKIKIRSRKFSIIGVVSGRLKIRKNRYIQVDIIPVSNLNWGTFIYHAPRPTESKYKGLYRNALIEAVAKSIHFNKVKYEIDQRYFKKNDINSYTRYRMIKNFGLWSVVEKNKGIRKFKYEKIQNTYNFISNNPKRIISILLGVDDLNNIKTFESVWKIVSSKNFKHNKVFSDIIKNFKIIIKDRLRMDVPNVVTDAEKSLN